MGRNSDLGGMELLLSKLDKIDSRLDSIEEKIEANTERIHDIGDNTVVKRMIRMGTEDVGEVCGVISVGHNELIGERGPSALSAKKKADRNKRQALGAKIFGVYCMIYGVLMILSYQGMLPLFAWETMKFKRAEIVSVWLGDNMHLPFVFSLAYVITIFGIQHVMKDHKEFDLRMPLAIWSLLLAAFSLGGSLRTVPVLIKLIQEKGLYHLVCGDTRVDWVIDNPAGVWTMFFIFSKVPELIDTLFIVLRKRKLITLHWYHHITVMTFCWHSWATFCLNGLVYSSLNLTVHAFMYFFYALTALGYRPTAYAMYITIIQILQMVVGTAVTTYTNYHLHFVVPQDLSFTLKSHWNPLQDGRDQSPSCKVNKLNALAGLIMYGSYLWLFCVFFYVSYIKPKAPKKRVSKSKHQ